MGQERQRTKPLFKSFWFAGFEAADHINRAGSRLDMLAVTQHDQQVDADYASLAALGIRTVRDAVRWSLVDRGGHYDFSSVVPMVEAANRHRMQVIWSLCHYGGPDDVDIFSPQFVGRFERYCQAVAGFLREHSHQVPCFVPVNEISFLAWAAGEVGYIHPCAQWRGLEVKQQLVRAAIAGIEAVWAVDSRARIIHVDPLIHVVPPPGRNDVAREAAIRRATQFEAWDMLAGHIYPELGGAPQYLDIVGANFYHANQWEFPERPFGWDVQPLDERWIPLHRLLAEVYERYRRPVFISETGHFGSGRAAWLRFIAAEVRQALAAGVPLAGICLYPIIDRPDWDDPNHWHNCGLWDLHPNEQGQLQRILHQEYAGEFERARAISPGAQNGCAFGTMPNLQEPARQGARSRMGGRNLLVFSNRGWDAIPHRLQQQVLQLVANRRVLFVETPVHDGSPGSFWESWYPLPHVTVARLCLPGEPQGFRDQEPPLFLPMLRQLLAREGFDDYLVWLAAPEARSLVQALAPHTPVYEGVEELLSALRQEPALLTQHARR
jgi:UDP-galactopyranose mutase